MAHEFPLRYTPRPYQAALHKMWNEYRTSIAVLPRQSGKDVAMAVEMMQSRLQYPKTNGVYIAPDSPMVRNIIWDKSYFDPEIEANVKLLEDNVPKELVNWKNTLMEGRFTNKSIMKLEGYFQSGRDQNGVGTSFDDYAITELALFTREDPIPRLMPIITSENGRKRLMAVSTPRGKRNNPLWQLIQSLDGQPNFKYILRTIDDLNAMMRKMGLPPVRSEQQLELDQEMYRRRFGNDRMFHQEYYCSFEEMDAAAVYGEAFNDMVKDRRNERFNLNPAYPVYVAFDIGSAGYHSDATSWIAFQWYNEKLFIYDSGEGHGIALPDYVDILREKHYFNKIAYMILPWDGDHHEVSISETPADMMRKKFENVAVLARGTNIYTVKGLPSSVNSDTITHIQAVRMQMYNTYFNGLGENEQRDSRPNADRVLECMENYKYSYNSKLQMWSEYPVHDQYSHMMDTLRYVVQATKELEFFKGNLYDTGKTANATKYVDDWAGVWG